MNEQVETESIFRFACKCVDNEGTVVYKKMDEVGIIQWLDAYPNGYVVAL